mmetsp:Transcript_41588/g.69479  ORF Transcript_41588/g.69479 Transcript_41588/m.69479 type:complete len:755 (+) Transcript_41588:259-2523(+)
MTGESSNRTATAPQPFDIQDAKQDEGGPVPASTLIRRARVKSESVRRSDNLETTKPRRNPQRSNYGRRRRGRAIRYQKQMNPEDFMDLNKIEEFVEANPKVERMLEAGAYTLIISICAMLVSYYFFPSSSMLLSTSGLNCLFNSEECYSEKTRASTLKHEFGPHFEAVNWIRENNGFVKNYISFKRNAEEDAGVYFQSDWGFGWPYKGEVIMQIPETLIITEENVHSMMPELRSFHTQGYDPISRMALFVLSEMSSNYSKFGPYLSYLPSLESMKNHPILACKKKKKKNRKDVNSHTSSSSASLQVIDCKRELRSTGLRAQLQEEKKKLKQQAKALLSFMKQYSAKFSRKYLEKIEYAMYAILLVTSRAHIVEIGKWGIMCLVPVADLANHSSETNILKWKWSDSEKAIEVQSSKESPLGNGMQLYQSYGVSKSNSLLMKTRGFAELNNKYESVTVRIPMKTLKTTKRESLILKEAKLLELGIPDFHYKVEGEGDDQEPQKVYYDLQLEGCWYISPEELMILRVTLANKFEMSHQGPSLGVTSAEQEERWLERIQIALQKALQTYPHSMQEDEETLVLLETKKQLQNPFMINVIKYRLTQKRIIHFKIQALTYARKSLRRLSEALPGDSEGFKRTMADLLKEAHEQAAIDAKENSAGTSGSSNSNRMTVAATAKASTTPWTPGFCRSANKIWAKRKGSWPETFRKKTWGESYSEFVEKWIIGQSLMDDESRSPISMEKNRQDEEDSIQIGKIPS